MNPVEELTAIRRRLGHLLDTADLGEATESVDRALDQVGYALDELNEDTEHTTEEETTCDI